MPSARRSQGRETSSRALRLVMYRLLTACRTARRPQQRVRNWIEQVRDALHGLYGEWQRGEQWDVVGHGESRARVALEERTDRAAATTCIAAHVLDDSNHRDLRARGGVDRSRHRSRRFVRRDGDGNGT